jgi:hypothetical protein
VLLELVTATKVTVPVGVTPLALLTVAVKVTDCPEFTSREAVASRLASVEQSVGTR